MLFILSFHNKISYQLLQYSKIVILFKYNKSYHMRTSQVIYTYNLLSQYFLATYLKNIFLSSCAARVSFEYFPLEIFAFIINDVIWKEQQIQRCLISDLTHSNEFLKRDFRFVLLRANEYFRTEIVKLPKKNSAKVFNI